MSTKHAKIELQRNEVVLVDVGSTNGTTVDGAAIEEAKPRDPGARSNVAARDARGPRYPLKTDMVVQFGCS